MWLLVRCRRNKFHLSPMNFFARNSLAVVTSGRSGSASLPDTQKFLVTARWSMGGSQAINQYGDSAGQQYRANRGDRGPDRGTVWLPLDHMDEESA